jgi:hypothetical protein
MVLYLSHFDGEEGWEGGGQDGMAYDTNDLNQALKVAQTNQSEEGGVWKVYDTQEDKDIKIIKEGRLLKEDFYQEPKGSWSPPEVTEGEVSDFTDLINQKYPLENEVWFVDSVESWPVEDIFEDEAFLSKRWMGRIS